MQASADRENELEREWKERVREAERRVGSRTQAALRTVAQERDKVRGLRGHHVSTQSL